MIFIDGDRGTLVMEHVAHWRWSDDYHTADLETFVQERALLVYMSSGIPFRFVGDRALEVERVLIAHHLEGK